MRPAVDVTLGDGRYRLQQRLGAGGMASVWLAVDERLERPVAVKIVADTLADDEQWVRRFQREAQAAAALSHPGVVPVFDYGVQEGRPYLVMEYVAGGTLADRLRTPPAGGRDGGAISSPLDADRLARELLEALGAVHAAGILHRDVKPANLLFDARGHIRLTDFGIAQAQDSSSLTRTGMVIGTLRYLAPEVSAGQPASVQSDLYSAGVVIRQVAGEPPPASLSGLIAALTAEDPRDRPESAPAALGRPAASPAASSSLAPDTAATRPLAAEPTAISRLAPETIRSRRPFSNSAATHRLAPDPIAPGLLTVARRPLSLLAAAAALILVVVVIVLLVSGGGSRSSSSPPSPAPSGSSVPAQVQALTRIVKSASRR